MIDARQRDIALLSLTTWALPAEVQPLSARDVRTYPELSDAHELLGISQPDLMDRLRTDRATAQRFHALLARAPQVAQLLERWEHQGIWVLTEYSPDFPAVLRTRLGAQAPILLHGVGDHTLLDGEGLGVVGSRNLTPRGEQVARELGSWAASHSRTLVSGGARGADRVAGVGALEDGGRSVWIVADGLRNAVGDPSVRTAVLGSQLAICSPYHPDAGFSAGSAMGRNKVIYAMATGTVVVACEHGTGGTWAGATEALKKKYGQVLVYRGAGEGPGNAQLEAIGAAAMRSPADLDSSRKPPHPAAKLPQDITTGAEKQLTLDL